MLSWDPQSNNQNDLLKFVFEQCKDEWIEKILRSAQEELPRLTMNPVFNGYVGSSKTKVQAQVQAVYETLSRLDPELVWSIEPKDNVAGCLKQSIRSVDDIFRERRADCIDIVSLFASLLVKIGLNPLIAVVGPAVGNTPTHAMLGYWLEDNTSGKTKLKWSDKEVVPKNMSFLECTGVLRGHKLPFSNAKAEVVQFIPKNDRQDIMDTFQEDSDSYSYAKTLLSEPNSKVYYVIDIRSQSSPAIPIIAIMGAKGGVGKTAITARMAELMAETGKNVLIIDFDVEKQEGGSSGFQARRTRNSTPTIKTVYDHFIRYSEPNAPILSDTSVWQTTPPYLQQKNLGNIFLIPAKPRGVTGGWDVIANISKESKSRNEILAKEFDRIIQRVSESERGINCIIVDCGAGTNPIYSAAFSRANYALIIATPERDCLEQIDPIIREHKVRYPKLTANIFVVLNRVSTQKELREAMYSKWAMWQPIGAIPEDPKFQEDTFLGNVNFDLGYDSFSNAIREVLDKLLSGVDRSLVPNEIDVRIKPWLGQIEERQLPKKKLKSLEFRLKTFLSGFFLGGSIASTVGFAWLIFSRSSLAAEQSTQLQSVLLGLGLLLSIICIVPAFQIFRLQLRKRKLLIQLRGLGNDPVKDKELINDMLVRSREKDANGALKWIRELLEKAIQEERDEERRSRIGLPHDKKITV